MFIAECSEETSTKNGLRCSDFSAFVLVHPVWASFIHKLVVILLLIRVRLVTDAQTQ